MELNWNGHPLDVPTARVETSCEDGDAIATPVERMNGMTYDEIKDAWNARADEHNQWDALGEDEKIEWAASIAAAKEREDCARVAERMARLTAARLGMEIQDACAAAIRARQ